jgi:serine/threonine-protein kinase RIO1
VVFDVSQALLTAHPLADSLMQRDISNINSYFRRLGVKVRNEEELEQWVKDGTEDLS